MPDQHRTLDMAGDPQVQRVAEQRGVDQRAASASDGGMRSAPIRVISVRDKLLKTLISKPSTTDPWEGGHCGCPFTSNAVAARPAAFTRDSTAADSAGAAPAPAGAGPAPAGATNPRANSARRFV
jgi:hypothetical protein